MALELEKAKDMVKEAGKSITVGGVKTVGVCFILYVVITYTAPSLFEKGASIFKETVASHNQTLERISTNLAIDRREVIGQLNTTLERTNKIIERNTETIGANTTTLQETKNVLWRINNKLEKDDKHGEVSPCEDCFP